jgi:rhamnosyl/mannosyltransferase
VVVPFGENLERYTNPDLAAVAAVRKKFSAPILLAVGRLVYYKGFEVLIRALQHIAPPTTLLIIGEGPMERRLQAQINALGFGDRIHLLGNVADPRPYYQACDLFVLASIAPNEAFGIVQLEAMACGKPVINTQLNSGVPYVSRHGETGLTVPPGDVGALARAINQLLADSALRGNLGEAGRRRVGTEFREDSMLDRILAIYTQIAIRTKAATRV